MLALVLIFFRTRPSPGRRPTSPGERGLILCACVDLDLLPHSALTRPAADLSRGEGADFVCLR